MGLGALILGPALPYVAAGGVAALALGAWQINDRAYDRAAEHYKRLASDEHAVALVLAQRVVQAREDNKSRSETADADRTRSTGEKMAPIEREVIRYVSTPDAGRACLSARGRLLAQSAIDAANAATHTPGEIGPGVPVVAAPR